MHRNIRLTAPYTRGPDVRTLQKGVNARLRARGKKAIKVDGAYGAKTAEAARHALWYLGAPMSAIEAGATVANQRVIVNPGKYRPKTWVKTAASRKRAAAKVGQEAAEVARWVRKWVGEKEHPAGSNRGPNIDRWEREVGMQGQPWCGALVVYGLRHIAGITVPDIWRWTPAILADARAGRYGMKLLSPKAPPRVGDILLYDFRAGGDPVMHTGFYIGDGETGEGNTSDDDRGSQDNGGMVAARKWSERKRFCVGIVRPPYGK